MKRYAVIFFLFISIVGVAQDYDGAVPYWEREENKVNKPGTPGNYIQKGGGLLLFGDVMMLGSAATAIIGTYNYTNYEPEVDLLDPAYADGLEKAKTNYNTTLIVSGGAFAVGFLMRMLGHAKLQKAGELMQLNDKTSLNVSGSGLMLTYKF